MAELGSLSIGINVDTSSLSRQLADAVVQVRAAGDAMASSSSRSSTQVERDNNDIGRAVAGAASAMGNAGRDAERGFGAFGTASRSASRDVSNGAGSISRDVRNVSRDIGAVGDVAQGAGRAVAGAAGGMASSFGGAERSSGSFGGSLLSTLSSLNTVSAAMTSGLVPALIAVGVAFSPLLITLGAAALGFAGVIAAVGLVGGAIAGFAGGVIALVALTQGWTVSNDQVEASQKSVQSATQAHTAAVNALNVAQANYNKNPTAANLATLQAAQQRVKQTTDAMTQAQNQLTDAQNKANNPLHTLVDDLKSMAQTLGAEAIPLATRFLGFLDSQIPTVQRFGENWINYFGSRMPQVMQFLSGLTDIFWGALNRLSAGFQGFIDEILARWPTLGPLFSQVLNAGVDAIGGLLQNLVRLTDWFTKEWPKISPVVSGTFDALGRATQSLFDALGKLVDQFTKFWDLASRGDWEGVGELAGRMVGELLKAINDIDWNTLALKLIAGGAVLGAGFAKGVAQGAGAGTGAPGASVAGGQPGTGGGTLPRGASAPAGGTPLDIVPGIGPLIRGIQATPLPKDPTQINQWFAWLWGVFGVGFQTLGDNIKHFVQTIPDMFDPSIAAPGSPAARFGEWVGSIFNALGTAVHSFNWGSIGQAILNAIWPTSGTGILQPIQDTINGIIQQFQRLPGAIQQVLISIPIVGFFYQMYLDLVGQSIVPDIVNGIVGWFGSLPGRLGGLLAGLSGLVGGAFADIFATVSGWLNAIWSWVGAIWGGIFGTVSGWLNAIWSWVGAIWGGIFGTISGWLNAIWTWVGAIWGEIFGTISGWLNAIWSWVGAIWGGIFGTVSAWLNAIWTWVGNVWNGIFGTISGWLNSIWTWVGVIWGGIFGTISGWLNSIWTWIGVIWGGIFTTISSWLNNIWTWVGIIWGGIFTTISSWLNTIWTWIQIIWNAIFVTISSWLNTIWTWVNIIWNAIFQTIANWLNTIWTWINIIWNAIFQTISNWLNTIWTWVSIIWGGIYGTITGWGNAIKTTLDSIWSAIGTAAWTAFTNLANSVRGQLNWIIDNVINAFANAVNNSPLGKIGVHIDTMAHFAEGGVPQYAKGSNGNAGVYAKPTYLVGEENIPETVIPWNPRYRSRALQLWRMTGQKIGALARGGVMAKGCPNCGGSHLGMGGGGMGAGPDLNNLPTSGKGGQCLAFLAQWFPQLRGIPAAKDAASLINSQTPKAGEVAINTSFAPYGHAALVINPPNMVLDSNFGEDEMIRIHPLADVRAAGFIDFGATLGTLAGGVGQAIDVGSIINGLIQQILGNVAPYLAEGAPGHWLANLPKALLNSDLIIKWIQTTFASQLASAASSFSGAVSGFVQGAMNAADITRLALQAGWPPSEIPKLLQIIQRESGGNPNAIGPQAGGDGGSIGLLQVQPFYNPQFDKSKLRDPLYNLEAGLQIWKQGGWGRWSTNFAKGGIPFLSFDNGNVAPEGLFMGLNNTGAPEPLVSPALTNDVRQGDTVIGLLEEIKQRIIGNLQVNTYGTDLTPRDVAREIVQEFQAAR